MDFTDIGTYIIQQGIGFRIVLTALLVLGMTMIYCAIAIHATEDNCEQKTMIGAMKFYKKVFVYMLVLNIAYGLIPTHDKIVRFKISKIKNSLVTSENVDAGIERVTKIADKLEKKYLGGD